VASGRASLLALCLGAAALGGAAAKEILPGSGPLGATTMQRLLLVDAERFGSRIVAVGDRGYIVYSDDQGKSWQRARAPAAPLLTALDFLDDQLGIAVGHDSVILATRDRGETWTQVFSAPAEQRPLLDVIFLTRDLAIAIGAYGAYYDSNDGGKTWTARKVLQDDKHLNAILELGDNHLLLVGEAGTMLTSDDLGKTWKPATSPYKGSFFGGLVANDGSVVVYGLRGHVFRSADRGKTWKAVENKSTAALMGGDKLPDGALVVAGGSGTMLVSRDNGVSFQPVATGGTRAFSKVIVGGEGKVLGLGEAGVREIALPWSSKP
jgi:photosystem II stability/assembly factor-like uncharacterized protein